MSRRTGLARRLIRLGACIQSLSVVVMKPDDLVEFSRKSYNNPQSIDDWTGDACVDRGLYPEELDLLESVPRKTGNLLLLGVGGGREAIPLRRMGFRVTGVDNVAAMVERAQENAARRGLAIDGLVQEMSTLDVPAETFDVVWISWAMYSCVPTRKRRVQMVKQIARALKPGGLFICTFRWQAQAQPSSWKGLAVRRGIALFTLGNLAYEEGDMLWGNVEFIHEFRSEADVRKELEEGGLDVLRFQAEKINVRGAVCRKSLQSS